MELVNLVVKTLVLQHNKQPTLVQTKHTCSHVQCANFKHTSVRKARQHGTETLRALCQTLGRGGKPAQSAVTPSPPFTPYTTADINDVFISCCLANKLANITKSINCNIQCYGFADAANKVYVNKHLFKANVLHSEYKPRESI